MRCPKIVGTYFNNDYFLPSIVVKARNLLLARIFSNLPFLGHPSYVGDIVKCLLNP